MSADSENGEANVAVMDVFKKIVLDASCVLPLLISMKDVQAPIPQNAPPRRKKIMFVFSFCLFVNFMSILIFIKYFKMPL